MKLSDISEIVDRPPTAVADGVDAPGARPFGQPYQTADGATVIPVTKPVGVVVVRGGEATWVPAVDQYRIALVGVLTGLLAAVIGSLAVLRQPPWPRFAVTGYR